MLLIAMLVALSQASAGESGRQRIVRGACQAIEVSSAQDPTTRSGRLPSFAATRIIDLRIAAVLRPAPARGVLRLKVRAPGGFLYQTLTVPFEAQAVSAVDRRFRVSANLSVAGTLITTNGLYGRWTVEPWLDGLSTPCGAPQAFVIGE